MNIYKLTDFGDQELIIGSRADYSKKRNLRLVDKDWLLNVVGNDNTKIFQKDYGFDEKAFLQKYNLRAVQFGNWMNYSERADHFLALVQSLTHLEKIIGSENIGWYGRLSIAIGARGKSGALAHFEPQTNAINLTKEKGGHSFAHEYGHAIDFIGGELYSKSPVYYSISDARLTRTIESNTQTDEIRNLMGIVIDGVRSGERYHTLEIWSKAMGRYNYWCNNTEIWARTFAQWVALECKKRGYQDTVLSKTIDTGGIENIPEKELKALSPYIEKIISYCSGFLNKMSKPPVVKTKNPFILNKQKIEPGSKKKVAASKNKNSKK